MAEETVKLARASISFNEDAITRSLYTEEIDSLTLPKTQNEIIDHCRFYYKRDSLGGSVVDKIVDFAITDLVNGRGDCTDEEFAVYNAILGSLKDFFIQACLEYLITGIIIPHYEWDRVKGSDISEDLNSRRRVNIPVSFWFRDPKTIELKKSPLPNKVNIYAIVDTEMIDFIKGKGKLHDGTIDKVAYEQLIKNYPEFVKQVLDNKGGTSFKIKLENVRPIFGRVLSDSVYPVPFLFNALEAMRHKRNLRKMDYAIAARVQSAIQVIKLGNDLFPCTDPAEFDNIRQQMDYRNIEGYRERLYQLYSNHTLEISWIYPNTEAMLNQEKYREVNDDIMAALGFPRSLIVGETLRSNSMQADLATYSPIATMEAIRSKFLSWVKVLYEEIKTKNSFKHVAKLNFTSMRIHNLKDLLEMDAILYNEGSLSRQGRLEVTGRDFDVEADRRERENQTLKDRGLDEFAPVPYSPQPNAKPDNNITQRVKKKPITEIPKEK